MVGSVSVKMYMPFGFLLLVVYATLNLASLVQYTCTIFCNLQQNMARTDDNSWKERETAVLCLGAIAEGCISGLYPHLPQVILMNNE
jgi:hypothetical protein